MEVVSIPLEAIVLDDRNPRIAHSLEGVEGGELEQEYLQLLLGAGSSDDEASSTSTSYASLKASIRTHKGLITPIIVTPTGDGKYVVIEGNTRVAIYRELAEEDPAEPPWQAISAIVQPSLSEKDEHAIRLQAHLVGPRPWRPYAKAKYLSDLYHNKKLSLNEIQDFCGGNTRKREIDNYIKAFADMQEFYMPLVLKEGGAPDYQQFSSFVELQSIKAPLLRAGFSEKDFAEWVMDSKLSPQNTVRQLPRILANPSARHQFLVHNAREALKVLDQPSANSVLGSVPLEQLAEALTVKVRQLTWTDSQALKQSVNEPPAQAVIGCFDELKTLVEFIQGATDG